MVALVPTPGQLPLIQFVESDDLYLQDQPDVLWFDCLSAHLGMNFGEFLRGSRWMN